MSYTPRLKEKYKKEIVPALKERFKYKSVMQVPRLQKICVNQGVGAATADKKIMDAALAEMSTITGQKAVSTKSKKDISNFKLRANVAIGARRQQFDKADDCFFSYPGQDLAREVPDLRFLGIQQRQQRFCCPFPADGGQGVTGCFQHTGILFQR